MPTITDYLKYANLQMAAEAFLYDEGTKLPKVGQQYFDALIAGNNHASRFTQELATDFVSRWTVVDQKINTETGFSGTLFRNNANPSELVISFRSTEFIDDAVRDNLATNTMEIKNTGFAWGQIADMEAWYASLKADPAKLGNQRVTVTGYSLGGHLATAFNLMYGSAAIDQVITFNGAGVGKTTQGTLKQSLDEFNRLRGSTAAVAASFTNPVLRSIYLELAAVPSFTPATVSQARARIERLYSQGMSAEALRLWKALGEIGDLLAESARVPKLTAGGDNPNERPQAVADSLILGEKLNYRMAVALASRNTETATLSGGLARAYTGKEYLTADDIARMASGPMSSQFDALGAITPSAVANSQWHVGANVPIFIEDQPLYRGGVGTSVLGAALDYGDIKLLVDGYANKDFGDTHSLVLLVDSLSVQNVLLQLMPDAERGTAPTVLNTILQAASNLRKVDGDLTSGNSQGKAEGDVLENVVNALADVLLGPDSGIDLNGSPEGNTWAKDTARLKNENYTGRDDLYKALATITASPVYKQLVGKLQFLPVSAEGSTARTDFAQFLTLYYLAPFQLKAADTTAIALLKQANATLAQTWEADAALTTEDRAAGKANFSDTWLSDRAAMAAWKSIANTANVESLERDDVTGAWDFSDVSTGKKVSVQTRQVAFSDIERHKIFFGSDITDSKTGGIDALTGNAQSDHLFGMSGIDLLQGKGGDDWIEGGKDADVLIGGADNDILNGGQGLDSYVWTSDPGKTVLGVSFGATNDGNDVILDCDKVGRILINGAGVKLLLKQTATTWTTPDGKVTLAQTDGRWKLAMEGGSLDLGTSFSDGDYGVYRLEITSGGPIIRGDLKPVDHDITTPAEDLQYDSLGNVIVSTAEAPGREDRLYGAEVADTLLGLEGNDIINGKGGADLMEGGTGSDILIGDAGNDMIYGLSGPAGSTPLATALASGESDTNQDARGDWVDGQTGDDILVGTAAQDLLTGGTDNDLLIGGAGNDLLLGDAALAQAWPDWNVDRRVEPDAETNSDLYRWTITRGSTTESDSIGGADVLYGGKGEDWLLGGAGDDLLDGGADADVIFGQAGNDVLLGGAGNDVINGDSASLPENLQGNDWIDGGAGDDRIWGMAGDDILIGGLGNDILNGGRGRDTYFISADGKDRIVDADTDSVILFGDNVAAAQIKLRKGSLLLDFGNGAELHIENFDPDHPLDTQSFASFQFADGSSLTWNELLARGFDLDGTDGDDTIFGTGIEDRIDAKAGNDLVWAGAGNDVITGGTGTDGLNGGLGDDTYLFNSGDGATLDGTEAGQVETLVEEGGSDIVRFAGIDAADLVLRDNLDGSLLIDYATAGQPLDRLLIDQGLDGRIEHMEVGAGATARTLSFTQIIGEFGNGLYRGTDEAGHLHLTGGQTADSLYAAGGGNVVSGGRGNDDLQVYGTDNTLLYSVGDGTDTVSTAGGQLDGNVLRLSGVTADDVKLGLGSLALQVGDDVNDVIHFESFDPNDVFALRAFDHIEFDDGSTLGYEALIGRGFDIVGTDQADILTGTSVADRIVAGAGDDVLNGGAGDDTLAGGAGLDHYRLGLGIGTDTVTESAGEISEIRLDAGIEFANLTAAVAGSDVVLSIGATANSLRLNDHAGSAWDVVLADGTRMALADVLAPQSLTGEAAVRQVWADAKLAVWDSARSRMLQEGWTQSADFGFTRGYSTPQLAIRDETTNYLTHRVPAAGGPDTVTESTQTTHQVNPTWSATAVWMHREATNFITRNIQVAPGSSQIALTDIVISNPVPSLEQLNIIWGAPSLTSTADTSGVWTTYPADGWTEWSKHTEISRQTSSVVSAIPVADVPSAQINVLNGNQLITKVASSNRDYTLLAEVTGTAGNDSIDSNNRRGGSWVIQDQIDFVDGGAGNDILVGSGGDLLYGNDGDDVLFGTDGTQILIGGRGNDRLEGANGGDIYRILNEDGIDAIRDIGSDDVAGYMYSAMGIGDSELANRTMWGGSWVAFGWRQFSTYADVVALYSPAGYDPAQWIASGDLVYYEPLPALPPLHANDYRQLEAMYGTAIAADRVLLGSGITPDNISVSGNDATGFLLIDMADGTGLKVALAKAGDLLGTGVELFEFADGTALTIGDLVDRMNASHVVDGTPGSDIIVTGAGDDILSGGAGNDSLTGGSGDDVYVFGRGDGYDVVSQSGALASDHDVIRFGGGIAPEDVVVTRDADGVHLGLSGDDGSIRILQQPGEAPLPAVEFADGTVWDASVFVATPLYLTGTAVSDTLVGTSGHDVIDGGAGVDTITGGAGDDVFLFGRGDGADSLYLPAAGSDDRDIIRFKAGVAPEDLLLVRDASGLRVAIANTTDSIEILGQFGQLSMPQVEFLDGTVWNASVLSDVRVLKLGTAAGETLMGTNGVELMRGLGGDDSVWAYGGDDALEGGDGADQLYGGAGNDILDGGPGNDLLASEAGDDVYIFGRGDGVDNVFVSSGSGGADTLRFKQGVAPGDVTLVKYFGSYRLIIDGSGDSIRLGTGVPLMRVEFADGTVWGSATVAAAPNGIFGGSGNENLAGTAGNDVLIGDVGDDMLTGGGGDDVYLFGRGDGRDTVFQPEIAAVDSDVIRFKAGVLPADVVATRGDPADNGGVRLTIRDTGDSIGVFGYEAVRMPSVAFADGTVWAASVLNNVVTTFSGSSGDESIVGTSGPDVFSGLQGSDTLSGGAGDDTYVLGSGATLVHISDSDGQDLLDLQNINLADISLGVGSLKITVTATGQEIHLDDFDADNPYAEGGIEYFRFADGTLLTKTELINALGFHPTGTGGDDLLEGTSLDDVMVGLGGNDTLVGRGGNDVLDGGSGDDTYVFASGDGHDSIVDADGSDRVLFGAGIPASQVVVTLDGGEVMLGLSDSDNIRFAQHAPGSYAIEHVEFADGGVWQAADILRALSRTPPTVAMPLADQAATEDAAFQFLLPAGSFADVDAPAGDVLSFAASQADGVPVPVWLAFDVATGTFFGTPGNDDVGSIELQVTATDLAGASATSPFRLTIANTNDAPIVGAGATAIQANTGTLFSWDLPAGTFVDPDANDVLSYGARLSDGSPLPSWLSVDVATGALAGTPGPGDAGELSIELVATDGSGATAASAMTLIVVSLSSEGETFIGTRYADTLTGTDYDDVFDGRAGIDTLIGLDGSDLYLVTDRKDRIVEGTDGGFDTVWADTDDYALPDQVEGLALIGGEDYDGRGNGLGNLLVGNRGDNRLDGLAGEDILRGLAGDDRLLGSAGLDALDGGSGDDVLEDGAGAGFIAGGRGDDSLRLDGGADVIAFNRGDGEDRVSDGDGQNDTLSFGGGIRVGDLRLKKHGKDLIVDAGNGDSLQFDDWYKHSANRSIATLQVATDAGGALFERYDFAALVRKFDSVLAANKRIDFWTPGSEASRYRLGDATGDVAGGILATAYAASGALADIRPEQVSAALATPRSDAAATSCLPDMPLPPQPAYNEDHGDHGDHGSDGHGKDDRHDRGSAFGWHSGLGQFLTQREVEAAWQSWQQHAVPSPSASPIDYAMGWARLRDKLAGHHDENDWGGAWCSRAGGARADGFPLASGSGGFAGRGPIGLPGTALKTFEGLHEGFDRLHGS